MLVGNILLVTPADVWKCLGFFVLVGVFRLAFRKKFLPVSFDREAAYQQGLSVRLWDFLFYASFGFAVTSFVRIAGVLLIFTYLIVPAACGTKLARSSALACSSDGRSRSPGGVGGLVLSFHFDPPSGAAIVGTFGTLLIPVSIAAAIRLRASRARVVGQ
jgi:zinc/manganese transport system permease protein